MILKALHDFNADAWRRHRECQERMVDVPNGIACPKCGMQMMDTDRRLVLTTSPPQYNIHCPACKHQDFRTI